MGVTGSSVEPLSCAEARGCLFRTCGCEGGKPSVRGTRPEQSQIESGTPSIRGMTPGSGVGLRSEGILPSMQCGRFHSKVRALLNWMAVIGLLICVSGATAAAADERGGYLADKLAAGDYSRRGADTCLGCHDESEPFPTDALFETVHGHPGVEGSPFMPGPLASFPAGLQCEACHGPIGAHGQRILPDGVGAGADRQLWQAGQCRQRTCRTTSA